MWQKASRALKKEDQIYERMIDEFSKVNDQENNILTVLVVPFS